MSTGLGLGLGLPLISGGLKPLPQAKEYINALKTLVTVTPNMIKSTNLIYEMLLDLDLYDDTIGLYPILGEIAASHAINAKIPGTRDLTYFGSPTHNANGIITDGATNYIQFNTVASALTTNNLVSEYNRATTRTATFITHVGYRVNSMNTFHLYTDSYGYIYYQIGTITDGQGSIRTSSSGYSVQGLIAGTKNNNGRRIIKNDSIVATNNVTTNYGSMPAHTVNNSYYNAGLVYSAQNPCFFHLCAKGLTDGTESQYYQAIQDAQTIMERQV